MSVDSRFRMSQERLDELKKELEYLQTVREKEVSEQIKEARSFGDLSENSEYDEAKTEQGKLYSKIAEIMNLIENAVVLENVPTGTVISVGSRVTVREVGEEDEETYEIVGSQEANPIIGRISDDAIFYLMSRGLSEDEARAMLVRGIVEPVSKALPLEYAVEMNNLINLELKGSLK